MYFLIFAALFSLLLTALIITPYIIRDTITKSLHALGNKHVTINDVDFNPFTGYLAVHGINAYHGKHPELKIRSIIATLNWRKALNNHIVADSIRVSGALLTIRYKKNRWYIGGFPVKKTKKSSNNKKILDFYIKKAALRNINLRFISGLTKRSAFIRQIDLAGLNSKTIKRHGQLRITGTTQGARYDINALLTPFAKVPSFEFRVSLKHFPAKELQMFVRQKRFKTNGTVSYTGTWIINVNADKTIRVRQQGNAQFYVKQFSSPKMRIGSRAIKVSLRSNSLINILNGTSKTNIKYTARAPMMDLTPRNGTYKMQLKNIYASGKVTLFKSHKATSVVVAASASIRKFSSTDRQAKIKLLNAENIRLSKISYSKRKGINIGQIRTGKLAFAQTVKRRVGMLGEFNRRLIDAKSMLIRRLHINTRRGPKISIDGIYPRNLRISLFRNTNRWPVLARTKKSTKKLKLDLPPLTIKQITLRGYNLITLYDRSFKSEFKSRIRIRQFKIKSINTRQLNKKSTFLFSGIADNYTRFRFTGDIKPFTKNINLRLYGYIKELLLRKFSRYTKRYYGYQITSGHLDARFKLFIKNSKLSGSNVIIFRRLAVKRTTRHSLDKSKRKLPIRTVIKLLSNSKNEIKITVPNSGNLNDPNFQFGINYKKAFNSAFKRGLILALKYTQPVGQAFTLLSSARRLITSFRMKPVRFRGGSKYLSFGSRWGLKKVAKIMRKKKKVTVKLCSVYTNADIEFFQVESSQSRRSRRWAIRKARRLSVQRATQVKKYMVKKLKISSGRLFLCRPTYDKRDNKRPRVKISI